MPRHRLTTDASMLPVSHILLDAAPYTGRSGQHRATPVRTRTTTMRTGAFAAVAAALSLGFGGAAMATAAPAPNPAVPPNFTLPSNIALPKNLPPQLDDMARSLLPHAPGLGHGRAVAPTNGTVTSGYGPRWGSNHNGVDIANKVGTPVYAVTDGVVLESGPASGFGQWIRVRQDDGTVGVFGHVDQSFVHAGQKVRAGQQIGTVGNRGNSTGPHLHYEVWDKNGKKINPQVWLNKRNVHP